MPNALFVQGGHRPIDDEPTRRTLRPSVSCIADAQEDKIGPLSDAKGGRNNSFIACQRRHDHVTLSNSVGNEVAIELATDLIVQDEFQSKTMHARLLLRIHRV